LRNRRIRSIIYSVVRSELRSLAQMKSLSSLNPDQIEKPLLNSTIRELKN
jgi:hypothetical protein